MNRMQTKPLGPLFAGMVVLLLLASAPFHAWADDDALYGPEAPPGSSFLRAFNASAETIAGGPIADRELPNLEPYEGIDFIFFPAGRHTVTMGGKRKKVSFDANKYYTAVFSGGQIRIFENQRFSNRMKVLLLVYNLIDGTVLSLRTAEGRPVVDKVEPYAFGRREVNAVKIGFSLYDGERKMLDLRPVPLERGRAFSLFVGGTRSHPVPTWIVN